MMFGSKAKLTYKAVVGCHTGLKRENNEDNYYLNGRCLHGEQDSGLIISCCPETDELQFYAVFDGMGGEEHGEKAALIAAETLAKYHDMLKTVPYHDFDKYIDMFLSEANNRICEASGDLLAHRMGTTIALLCVRGHKINLYNIGDSRIYHLNKKGLQQVSEDHTAAVRAVKMGSMSEEEAKKHPHRHKLTQHLGILESETIIKPYRRELKVEKGDIYLLCSDGLTDMIDDTTIAEILSDAGDAEGTVQSLISAALDNGGRDNICVLLIKVAAQSEVD